MADIYLDSVTGSNGDDGSTRALAKATMISALAAAGAGGRIFPDDDHAETDVADTTLTMPVVGSPVTIISVEFDGASEPPAGSSVSNGAKVITTGAFEMQLNGSGYLNGIVLEVGTGGSGAQPLKFNPGGTNQQVYEDCIFRIVHTGSNSTINIFTSGSSDQLVHWKNCTVKFADSGQRIIVAQGMFLWEGGGIESGSASITRLFTFTGESNSVYKVIGVNLSNLATTTDLLSAADAIGGVFFFRNCKMPANWTGTLFVTTPTTPGLRGEMINCDDGVANYRLWIEDWLGVVRDETTVFRSGGASDGTTNISHKYATDASCNELQPFRGHAIEVEANFDEIGSELTATLHYMHDGADAKTNAQIWGQVEALGTSGFPLATFADDKRANVLTTPVNQSTSTEDWDDGVTGWVADTVTAVGNVVRRVTPNGTVMICTASAGDFKTHATIEPTWPAEGSTVVDDQVTWRVMRREKIDVAFTPQEKGVFLITPMLGEASITTLFLDPLPDVA